MTLTAAPRATGSAAWADALLLSFAQAGYVTGRTGDPAAGRAVSRPVGRGHPQEPLSDHRCQRRGTVPAPRPHHSGGAGLPRLQPRRPTGGLSAISDRCSAIGGGRPSEFLQAGIESFGRQDRAAADAEMLALALEATAAFGVTEVEIRTGDVALFIGADRRARPLPGMAAAADQGFQPQDQPGAGSRAADARDRFQPQRI